MRIQLSEEDEKALMISIEDKMEHISNIQDEEKQLNELCALSLQVQALFDVFGMTSMSLTERLLFPIEKRMQEIAGDKVYVSTSSIRMNLR